MKVERLNKALLGLAVFALGGWVYLQAEENKVLMLDKGSYQIYYNPAIGLPQLVVWGLSKSDIGKAKREPSFHFVTDHDTPKPRVKSSMYSHTGYQRGHMCPAADRSASKALMKSTFVMSNVCPMTARLNVGPWKDIETLERYLLKKYPALRIKAAPLFFPRDTQWIGNGRVAVPHAFIKVITVQGRNDIGKIFILDNK